MGANWEVPVFVVAGGEKRKKMRLLAFGCCAEFINEGKFEDHGHLKSGVLAVTCVKLDAEHIGCLPCSWGRGLPELIPIPIPVQPIRRVVPVFFPLVGSGEVVDMADLRGPFTGHTGCIEPKIDIRCNEDRTCHPAALARRIMRRSLLMVGKDFSVVALVTCAASVSGWLFVIVEELFERP